MVALRKIWGTNSKKASELCIGVDDVGDAWWIYKTSGTVQSRKISTFRRVKTGYLNDIFALGPSEFIHLLLGAETPKLSHVELCIPVVL